MPVKLVRVQGRSFRSIWRTGQGEVWIIDQTALPHRFETVRLHTLEDFAAAITEMKVRGAPLIGATAAYGVASHMEIDPSDAGLSAAIATLRATRPTAVNLEWALDQCEQELRHRKPGARPSRSFELADRLCEDDVAINRAIGENGLPIIRQLAASKPGKQPVQILTHCNAGWLATVDYGTATSPLYQAHEAGIALHVWVDETRPRNQGSLTAWELGNHGISHSFVTDNAGGHLMQRGDVDLVIVGTDRTLADGTVFNKIGTYLKALAARDNGVPFYVALPSPTIDWNRDRRLSDIPIEERGKEEVSHVSGQTCDGRTESVRILPPDSPVANPAFDATPARLVTGLITERGICRTGRDGLARMFPEYAASP